MWVENKNDRKVSVGRKKERKKERKSISERTKEKRRQERKFELEIRMKERKKEGKKEGYKERVFGEIRKMWKITCHVAVADIILVCLVFFLTWDSLFNPLLILWLAVLTGLWYWSWKFFTLSCPSAHPTQILNKTHSKMEGKLGKATEKQ